VSLDIATLRAAVRSHGRVARVLIVSTNGSTPRAFGTSMLVWDDGQLGTIGGGTLEYEATQRARRAIAEGDRVD